LHALAAFSFATAYTFTFIVCFFSIFFTEFGMITQAMGSKDFSLTSSTLVSCSVPFLNFVVFFTLGLKTGSTFSTIARMGSHVVVIKAFFTSQTEMISSHESFE